MKWKSLQFCKKKSGETKNPVGAFLPKYGEFQLVEDEKERQRGDQGRDVGATRIAN